MEGTDALHTQQFARMAWEELQGVVSAGIALEAWRRWKEPNVVLPQTYCLLELVPGGTIPLIPTKDMLWSPTACAAVACCYHCFSSPCFCHYCPGFAIASGKLAAAFQLLVDLVQKGHNFQCFPHPPPPPTRPETPCFVDWKCIHLWRLQMHRAPFRLSHPRAQLAGQYKPETRLTLLFSAEAHV